MVVHFAILVCGVTTPIICAALIGLIIAKTGFSSRWYQELKKPPCYPSDWMIPVIWTILNAMMGFASVIVWQSDEKFDHWGLSENRLAIIGYIVQFFLTNLWPVVFFMGQKVTICLIQLVIADAVLLFCLKLCFALEIYAGLLVLPQLMWTSYWILIMYSIWLVNYNTQQTAHEKLLSSHHAPSKSYGVYV